MLMVAVPVMIMVALVASNVPLAAMAKVPYEEVEHHWRG